MSFDSYCLMGQLYIFLSTNFLVWPGDMYNIVKAGSDKSYLKFMLNQAIDSNIYTNGINC